MACQSFWHVVSTTLLLTRCRDSGFCQQHSLQASTFLAAPYSASPTACVRPSTALDLAIPKLPAERCDCPCCVTVRARSPGMQNVHVHQPGFPECICSKTTSPSCQSVHLKDYVPGPQEFLKIAMHQLSPHTVNAAQLAFSQLHTLDS